MMHFTTLSPRLGNSQVRWFLFGAAIFAILLFLYFFYLLSPSDGEGTLVSFEIPRGSGIPEITRLLVEGRVVRSTVGFKLYTFLSGSAHQLKPGLYEFSTASTTPEVVRALVEGPPTDLAILIIEGQSLRDIDALLANRRIVKPGAFGALDPAAFVDEYPFLKGASNLEGFLFPDTYRFAVGSDPEVVAQKFLDNFSARVRPLFRKQKGDVMQSLTIASYLEREIPRGEDRRLVAGIVLRRLRMGMPLQVDATVLYAKCGGRFLGCDPLTRSDAQIDSPFNTYRYIGLTPTPIANPGLDAIRAALEPQTSRFLYYLSDPITKRTIFAETLPAHNRNRLRYLDR